MRFHLQKGADYAYLATGIIAPMSSPRARLERPESLHQQVAHNIRNDIEAGVLRHGQALPSTRELAAEWDTSVFTINAAMKLLADEGLVISKSRAKRVVNAPNHARRSELRLRSPHVILIGGYAGSGKTELGRVLARQTGWTLLDKDTLTRPVVEAALEVLGQSPHDRESETYFKFIRPREYEALVAAANENVECGNGVIVTAPFLREFDDATWIGRIQAAFTEMNAVTTLVWMHCDVDTMRTYLRHRGAARDVTKLADWPGYLASIDVEFRPPAPHIVIENCSSSTPLQAQAKELLATIMSGESA